MQQPLHFLRPRLRVLGSNAFPGHITGQLMELEGNVEAFFACHTAVLLDLQFHGTFGAHQNPIVGSMFMSPQAKVVSEPDSPSR